MVRSCGGHPFSPPNSSLKLALVGFFCLQPVELKGRVKEASLERMVNKAELKSSQGSSE